METEPRAADGSTASVPEEDVDEEEEEEIRPPKPNIPAEVLDGLSPAPTKDEGDDIAVVLGSEDWHRAVPSVRLSVFMFSYSLHFFTLAKGLRKVFFLNRRNRDNFGSGWVGWVQILL